MKEAEITECPFGCGSHEVITVAGTSIIGCPKLNEDQRYLFFPSVNAKSKTSGLTLIEAINSERRYRFVGSSDPYNWQLKFGIEDVLGLYELEPEPEQKIELTKKQIESAWDRAANAAPSYDINLLLKILGFKE